MTIESVVENYANGNLTDAKRGAKRHTQANIRAHMLDAGCTRDVAATVAAYLKNAATFEEACDANQRTATRQPWEAF